MGNSSSTSPASPPSRNGNERSSGSSSLLTGAANNFSSRITGGGSNNNASGLHIPSIQLPSSFGTFRGTGSLGLTKAELDGRCAPSGLYPSCEWDPKQIRRLIGNGCLAARLKGSDGRCTKSDRECPICFMMYSQSNVTKCCEATICTECYLQIKTPKEKNTTCPFCNCPRMQVSVQKAMDEDAIAKREEEEQRAIEGIIRNRAAQANGESPAPRDSTPTETGSFGSSLDHYNRSRTFSNSSSAVSEASSESCHTPVRPCHSANGHDDNDRDLLSLAMSPDARHQLEEEMAAQLSHETHRRIESEAEEARMRHVEEWSRSDSGMRSRMREARIAELTALLERMSRNNATEDEYENGQESNGFFSAFDYGGRGGGRGVALDNLMRLEAAFLTASGDGEGRRRPFRRGLSERMSSNESPNGFSIGSPRRIVRALPRRGVSTTHMETAEMLMRGISEEEQLAMAIAMSMTDETNRQNQSQQQNQHEQSEQEASTMYNQNDTSHNPNASLVGNEARSGSSSSVGSTRNDEIDRSSASNLSLAENEEEVIFETE